MKTFSSILLFAILFGLVPAQGVAQTGGELADISSLLTLFSAHALPSGDVRLNWTLEKQSPTIMKFRIYRGYEDVGNFAVLVEIPSHGLDGADYSYTDTSAQPGVSYYYKLASVGQRTESVFPVVISATSQLPRQKPADVELLPIMILPGQRVSLYVRRPGHVNLDVLSNPAKSLVNDSLRPGIYEFDLSPEGAPVTLRLRHESGYTAEVTWPVH